MSRSPGLIALLRERGDAPAALGPAGPVSCAQVLEGAARIAARLPDSDATSQVGFSFNEDRVGLLAGLLATWAKGHTAVLPEDGTRDCIVPIFARPEHACILHDTGVGVGLHVPAVMADPQPVPPLEGERLGDQRVALEACLQEPLGEARSERWTLPALLARLDELAAELGLAPGQHVHGSMAPSALPGLLLGLLAPLRAGASFAARTARDLPALEQELRARPGRLLVASPAHARDLARHVGDEALPLEGLVCVDEGLDTQTRRAWEHGLRVELLPTPALELDAAPDPHRAALREALLERAEVLDADVSALPRHAAPDGARWLVAVAADGAPELEAWLGNWAGSRAEASVGIELRVLRRLPRDGNGRLPPWRSRLLFGHGRAGHALETNLDWSEVPDQEPPTRRLRATLPEHYLFFEGHYTGYPVLAGAAQLHELVLPCVRRVHPELGDLRRMAGLKFSSRIAPGDRVEVCVRPGSAPGRVQFEVLRDGTRCSTGRLEFETSAEDACR